MNREIRHWSLEELYAQDARGENRHELNRPSEISVVHRAGVRSQLINEMEKQDPNGKKAHELAAQYRD